MNHSTLEPNPRINDCGIDDDQLEYRTDFAETEGGLCAASAKQRQDRRECIHCHHHHKSQSSFDHSRRIY